MSVDTKGFIALGGYNAENNVIKLLESIENSLNKVAETQGKKLIIYPHEVRTSGHISTRFELFKGEFFNRTEFENRMLSTNLRCSSDYSEVWKGSKIIFSLECVHSSKVIITQILKDLKQYGSAYFLPNDFTDEWEIL